MSERVERKLLDMLGHPTRSPYGNPIPGLEELGEDSAENADAAVVGLPGLLEGTDATIQATISRIGEPAQVDPELLGRLRRAGVLPAASGNFTQADDGVAVRMDGIDHPVTLADDEAAHLFVTV